MPAGSLALMILRTLDALGPLHGYRLARRIEPISGNQLVLNQGTLYPALLKLEHMGWITAKWGATDTGRRARFYAISRSGKKQLQAETENWTRGAAIVARFMRDLRTTLGASRWRFVQLLIVENLIIAALGGAAGVAFASGCLSLLLRSMPAAIVRLIPGFSSIRVDGRGLAFMLAVTVASGIVSGIVPAIGSARRRLVAAGPRRRARSATASACR